MNLAQFIATYTNQATDVDGVAADIGQCVQLVSLYCQKVLNVPYPNANAKDWWNNPVCLANFDQVAAGQPMLPGDIVVWGASNLINSPLYGHIDICVSADANGFTGFDSNWGGVNNAQGQPVAHEVRHILTDVLGYLRIKEKPAMNTDGVVNDDICNLVFVAVLHRHAAKVDLDAWRGHDLVDMINQLYHSQEWSDQGAVLANGSGVTKANVQTYINQHLS